MISVLYVDDERDLCEISRIFLERGGEFKVATAISAQEAIDLLHLTSYDVIISDYSMPGMDGIAFLKAVRERFGDLPFILFSGRGREEVVIEAINNGVDFYIQKGGDPKSQFAELRHKIRQAARKKQAERFLRESERRLTDIINFLPDATFAIDKKGGVIAWNHAIEDMTGVPAHEMLGKGDYAYSIPFYGSTRPILIDLLDESDDRFSHLYTNISRNGTSLMAETALATPKGRSISILARACPLCNENGEVTGAIESIRDITESKKTENSLRASEEKFRALVELSLEGIIITDFSGTLLFVNHTAGTIVDIDDIQKVLATKNVMDFVAPESQADVLRDITQVSQGIDAYLVSYKLITAKQREVWVECIGKKIQFENAPAMLVSMRDITERKRAETTIRESESKFTTVFQRSPISLTLVSATRGTFTDINDAFMRSTGFTRDAVIGRTSEELGLFVDPAEYEGFVSTLKKQRELHGMELKCRLKSGEIRICQFSSGIIMMKGEPHILSTVEDVTERKNTEEALQAIIRSMAGVTGIDSFKTLTRNVSSHLGADCVMIGEIQPDRETVKTVAMLLDGNDIDNFFYSLKGTPCENVAEKGFCIYPDNAATLFPESKDLSELNIQGYAGTPLRDSTGTVIGILCVLSRCPLLPSHAMQEFLDIIAVKASAELERIRIERALTESQQRLGEAIDLAHLVNWEYDVATGMFTFDNRFYALYGTTAESEGGTRMAADVYAREFVHPGDQGMVADEVKKAMETTDPGYISQCEHRIIRRDGEVRHIVVLIKVIKDEKGRTIRTRGVNQDITDRKRAEEALRLANRQLNLLTGITRHDILNNMTVLLGYLHLAEEDPANPRVPEFLRKMESTAANIRSQIEFTRIYQDLGTHEPQWLDLAMIIRRIKVPEEIALIADVENISVFASPMFEKVFFNLIDNSIRHGERVTGIRVSCQKSGDDLVIVWEDNGVGIPGKDKEHIFERGFGKNTGLGMFLAREVLALTGITIRETGVEGTGARFEIMVPQGKWR